MKGLLLKDLLSMKNYLKTFSILLVFYFVLSFFMKNIAFMGGMLLMVCAMLAITSFSYDDLAKWDQYAYCLPVRRRDVVFSKYLLAFILLLAGTVLSLLSFLCFQMVFGIEGLGDTLVMLYVLFGIAVVYDSILIPCIFKLGAEKSRFVMIAIFLVPMLLGFLLKDVPFSLPTEQQVTMLLALSPLFLIIIAVISVAVSLHVVKRKEF